MEKLAQETETHLETATASREDFSREFGRSKETALTRRIPESNVERLSFDKKEFDAFDQRLKTLQTAVGEAEAGWTAYWPGQGRLRADPARRRF